MNGAAEVGRSGAPHPIDPELGLGGAALEVAEEAEGAVAALPRSAEAARAERARRDEEIYRQTIERLLAVDPHALQEYFQLCLRDTQLRGREEGVRVADAAAREQARVRAEQHARAEEAERARREAEQMGLIFKFVSVIVSAVVTAVGAIGSIFTGGASLVAAIALTVALLGSVFINGLAEAGVINDPQVAAAIHAAIQTVAAVCSFGAGAASAVSAIATCVAVAAPVIVNQLAREGVLDPETAGIVGTAIAVVAFLVSMGAGTAGAVDSASQAATEAVERATEVAQSALTIVKDAAMAIEGGCQIGEACYQRDRDDRMADAQAAAAQVDAHLEAMEESSEALADILRAARRVAQRMQEMRESRFEAMSAAATAFARA
jgi:hypothetical protein